MLLRGANVITLVPPQIERLDLRVQGGTIVESARLLHSQNNEETVEIEGKLLLPGMVNAHTHLYSSLARGMSAPKQAPKNFLEILKKVWWRLDEALDEESIYYSALVGCIEAVRYGTTTLIDHHASPHCINGSLDIVKEAMNRVGVRGILCYETTDRGGKKRRDAGLQENARFITANVDTPLHRGTCGAHASFTLSESTMEALGDIAATNNCGVHIHAAEDMADVRNAERRHGISIVKRLQKSGILSGKSILAHGVHLSRSECTTIQKTGSWLIHNPRSNMNNAVGYAPLRWFSENAALGTDGFPSDMFEECKLGFFRNQESNHKVEFARIPRMLQSGQRLVSTFFRREFGTLKPHSPADLIVLDYSPPTPLDAGNLLGHFVFGMNSGLVKGVMVNGEWRMWNGEFLGLDEDSLMKEAAIVASKLWKRMSRQRGK